MDHLNLTLLGSSSKSPKLLRQGWTNPGGLVDRTSEVCTDAHNICGSSVWNLLLYDSKIQKQSNPGIEKNEMGGACGTNGGRERCAQGFGGET